MHKLAYTQHKAKKLISQAMCRGRLAFYIMFVIVFCAVCFFAYKIIVQADNTSVTNMLSNAHANQKVGAATKDNRIVVAIDAGHGGKDVGAEGVIYEKEVTEKTSKYLFDLLSKDSRFKPFLTREINLDGNRKIAERIETVNTANAQLLISIHGNSDPTGSYTGFECFAAPPGRKNHEESLKFASIIAENMDDAGHKLRGDNGVRYLYYVKDENGRDTVDLREHNYKDANRTDPTLAMVEKPNCPAVLVEQCFINNPIDYENWGNEKGSYKAAVVYYKSICRYFSIEPAFQ